MDAIIGKRLREDDHEKVSAKKVQVEPPQESLASHSPEAKVSTHTSPYEEQKAAVKASLLRPRESLTVGCIRADNNAGRIGAAVPIPSDDEKRKQEKIEGDPEFLKVITLSPVHVTTMEYTVAELTEPMPTTIREDPQIAAGAFCGSDIETAALPAASIPNESLFESVTEGVQGKKISRGTAADMSNIRQDLVSVSSSNELHQQFVPLDMLAASSDLAPPLRHNQLPPTEFQAALPDNRGAPQDWQAAPLDAAPGQPPDELPPPVYPGARTDHQGAPQHVQAKPHPIVNDVPLLEHEVEQKLQPCCLREVEPIVDRRLSVTHAVHLALFERFLAVNVANESLISLEAAQHLFQGLLHGGGVTSLGKLVCLQPETESEISAMLQAITAASLAVVTTIEDHNVPEDMVIRLGVLLGVDIPTSSRLESPTTNLSLRNLANLLFGGTAGLCFDDSTGPLPLVQTSNLYEPKL